MSTPENEYDVIITATQTAALVAPHVGTDGATAPAAASDASAQNKSTRLAAKLYALDGFTAELAAQTLGANSKGVHCAAVPRPVFVPSLRQPVCMHVGAVVRSTPPAPRAVCHD